ncbi:MAG: transposase, partial [Kiritimatiellia bacterium]
PMRTSLRNPAINYAHGWFFITTQVAMNKTMFGVIADGRCVLNALGQRVEACWLSLFEHRPEAVHNAHIVMPNHFHAVLKIQHRPGNRPNHLSYLVQIFKSMAANAYLEMRNAGQCPDIGGHLWMRSFYDNLITNHEELKSIRAYIHANPARWDDDRFGPVTTHHYGNLALLQVPLVAFVASQGAAGGDEAPPLREWRGQSGRGGASSPPEYRRGEASPSPSPPPVISTFTSAQERRVLARCLAAKRSFIHVMPGGIPPTLPPAVEQACNDGRGLLLSPSAPDTGVNKQRAIWCNRYVLEHAAQIWHGTIRPGGTLETLLRAVNTARKRGGDETPPLR